MVDNNYLIIADLLIERARAELYLGPYGWMSEANRLRGQDFNYTSRHFYPMRDQFTFYASFIWMDIPRVVFVEIPGYAEDEHFEAIEAFIDNNPVVDRDSARKFVDGHLRLLSELTPPSGYGSIV